MRKSITLTDADKTRAATVRPGLMSRIGTEASVSFIKADGTARTLAGTIVEVRGAEDKEVVVIETSEGYRSANVWRIRSVD